MLKNYLRHFHPILERIHDGLSHHYIRVGNISSQKLEGTSPDQRHIVPIFHDTFLDRVIQFQHNPIGSSLISNHNALNYEKRKPRSHKNYESKKSTILTFNSISSIFWSYLSIGLPTIAGSVSVGKFSEDGPTFR